jgi:hypothetical protein
VTGLLIKSTKRCILESAMNVNRSLAVSACKVPFLVCVEINLNFISSSGPATAE